MKRNILMAADKIFQILSLFRITSLVVHLPLSLQVVEFLNLDSFPISEGSTTTIRTNTSCNCRTGGMVNPHLRKMCDSVISPASLQAGGYLKKISGKTLDLSM